MYFKRQIILLGMVVHNFNLSTKETDSQIAVSLAVSLESAWTTQDPVLKKKKKKEPNK